MANLELTIHDRQKHVPPGLAMGIFSLNFFRNPAYITTLSGYLAGEVCRVDCMLYVLESMSEGRFELYGDWNGVRVPFLHGEKYLIR